MFDEDRDYSQDELIEPISVANGVYGPYPVANKVQAERQEQITGRGHDHANPSFNQHSSRNLRLTRSDAATARRRTILQYLQAAQR